VAGSLQILHITISVIDVGRRLILKMENSVKIQIAFAVILTIALIGFLYLTMNLNKDGLACQSNPLTYGVAKLQPRFENPITCSCMADDLMIFFNDTTMRAEKLK
jgi:hypothetical protein